MKTAIFITDASFNKRDKTSLLGIKNITEKKTYQKSIIADNPKEAEKKGILEAINIAYNNKIQNLVIVCDNKFAIQEIKRDFFKSESNKNKFWYIQFLWLKREYLEEADFLSKNINEELKKEVIENREIAMKQKIEKKEGKSLQHIYDIKIDKSKSEEVFKKRKQQFHKLVECQKFKSTLFTNQNISLKEAEELIFTEIEDIENDLKIISDIVEKAIAKLIFDLVLSFA